MLTLPKILITGFPSSGKTTVGRYLTSYQAFYVETDQIVHKLLSPKTGAGKRVLQVFGELDRKHLGRKVFANPRLLEQLESILHPYVIQEVHKAYQTLPAAYRFFVCEVPVLTQELAKESWDFVLWVESPLEQRLSRWLNKTSLSIQDYQKREKRQAQLFEKYLPQPVHSLSNTGNLMHLKQQIDQFFTQKMLTFINP